MHRGVLSHLSNLPPGDLDEVLGELTASLIVPIQCPGPDDSIETRYGLLPLTRDFIQSKLRDNVSIHRSIRSKIETVQNLLEEATRADQQYRYSLSGMGAETEEDKVAAIYAISAEQKSRAGDYDGAVQGFEKSAQIAPQLQSIYRKWAMVEADAGFYEKADELMRKATGLASDDPVSWYEWGNIEKGRQRFDQAASHVRRALVLSPNDALYNSVLGDIDKRRGNYEIARDLFHKSLEGNFPGGRRRHEIVIFTSLADNLRRWGDQMERDRQWDRALELLREAHSYATRALALDRGDKRAQDAFSAVALKLGIRLCEQRGLTEGKSFIDSAITIDPQRARDKVITQQGCYYLAGALLSADKSEEARRYYSIGRKALLGNGKFRERYEELRQELDREKAKGKLVHVISGKGYGFVQVDGDVTRELFIHRLDIVPTVSMQTFDGMEDCWFSFVIGKNDKGWAAKRARILES
jgi:tetratricopeptide (TPR) repeat protein